MKETNTLALLKSLFLSLALLSVAAGTCPTAKLGQTDCASTLNPTPNGTVTLPGNPPTQRVCVGVSVVNNRKRGICHQPNNKEKACETLPGSVAITYTSYAFVTDSTSGDIIDCNLTNVVSVTAGIGKCPKIC